MSRRILMSHIEVRKDAFYILKVMTGYMFSDDGGENTILAVFHFYTLLYPTLNAEIKEGLINIPKKSGWLPEWASPGHPNHKIGSNSSLINSKPLYYE